MPIFMTLIPLQHNGKPIAEGKEVEMTQIEAEELIEMGAIAPVGNNPLPLVPKQQQKKLE